MTTMRRVTRRIFDFVGFAFPTVVALMLVFVLYGDMYMYSGLYALIYSLPVFLTAFFYIYIVVNRGGDADAEWCNLFGITEARLGYVFPKEKENDEEYDEEDEYDDENEDE